MVGIGVSLVRPGALLQVDPGESVFLSFRVERYALYIGSFSPSNVGSSVPVGFLLVTRVPLLLITPAIGSNVGSLLHKARTAGSAWHRDTCRSYA
jgi:hypothetical protein